MAEWGVVTFKSAHIAVKAEKAAVAAGIEARLIPAPRSISYDCGVALRFPLESRPRIESALRLNAIEYERIAELESATG